ncbi:MAG: PKD domain-containing protein [Thermoplasmata archaeon]|nr:PKD domain-containing protein [Thermoplasmata archaeon]
MPAFLHRVGLPSTLGPWGAVLLLLPSFWLGSGAPWARSEAPTLSHIPSPHSPPAVLVSIPRPFDVGPRAGAALPRSTPFVFDNWPTYLASPERSSVNPTERLLNASNAGSLRLLWHDATTAAVFASPTFVNGTVYVGSWNGFEYALNASSGAIRWKSFLGTNSTCYSKGIDSSAAVAGGTLYVGGGDDFWYALNASTGKFDWKVRVGDTTRGNYNWASPLLFNGSLYIGVASCSDTPLTQGKLLEVNLTGNHSIVHEWDAVPASQAGATVWASPMIDPAAHVVWIATGNNNGSQVQPNSSSVLALNASTLRVLAHWQVPNVNGLDLDFGATPTLVDTPSGRHLVVVTNKQGTIYAFNRSNLSLSGGWGPAWAVPTRQLVQGLPQALAPAAYDGRLLYLVGGAVTIGGVSYAESVRAVDPDNGSTLWQAGVTNGRIFGAPALADGLLVDEAEFALEVRNASNGRLLYSFPDPDPSTGFQGSPTIANGEILFGSGPPDWPNAGAGSIYALALPLNISLSVAGPAHAPPVAVNLSARATGGIGPFSVWWTFGDGSNGTGAALAHTYDAPGTYTVTVNLTDSTGANRLASRVVKVPSGFTTTLSVQPGRVGILPFAVDLSSSVSGSYRPPLRYAWTLGDGSSAGNVSVVRHTYQAPGVFAVALQAIDALGVAASASATITVVAPLHVRLAASPLATEAPANVSFSANVTNGIPPYAAIWLFGDGATSTGGASAIHQYNVGGGYEVLLSEEDAVGEIVGASVNISVLPALSAGVQVDSIRAFCPSGFSEFSLNARIAGGYGPYSLEWLYPNGSVSRDPNLTVNLPPGPSLRLMLQVEDAWNHSASANTTLQPHSPACPFRVGPGTGGFSAIWIGILLGGAATGIAAAAGIALWIRRRDGGRPGRP